jgi:hypothetical protein
MLISDIVLHLMKYLPRFTDAFSDYQTPSAVSIVDGTVTVTCTGHGKKVGDYIAITHARTKNVVDSSTSVSNGVQFTTTSTHDFTEGYQKTALLKSTTNPEINAEYTIVEVPTSTTIILSGIYFAIPADAYISEYVSYSINGIFKVVTATPTQYTFELSFDDTAVPAGFAPVIDIAEVRLHHGLRITGAATIQRFMRAYEKALDGKMWACVTRESNAVSKSAAARSDATLEQTGYSAWNAHIMTPFTVHVIAPCYRQDGRDAVDAIESVRSALYSSLLGAKFTTGFSQSASSGIIPEDDGKTEYSETKIVVPFNFSQTMAIIENDISVLQNNSAFRAINIDFLNTDVDNDNVIMSLSISLDGE